MKRLIPLIFAALLAVLPSAGQNVFRNLGYTTTDDIDETGYFGEAGTYSVGALFSSEFLDSYDGCRITGMRIAAACDLGRTRMFVYEAGKYSTPVIEQKQRIYEGWNDISFAGNGIIIDKTKPLFCGFDYVETAEMITAKKGGLAFAGSAVTGGCMLLQGSSLLSLSVDGNICVQMVVDISSLPENNFRFTFFDSGFRYKKPDEKFDIMATLENVGRVSTSSITLAYKFDGLDAVTTELDTVIAAGASYTWQQSIDIPAELGSGEHSFYAWVDKINGQATGYFGDPAHCEETRFNIYSNALKRHCQYVEVYSDLTSHYSAAMENTFKATTDLEGEAQIVNIYDPSNALGIDDGDIWRQAYAYTVPSFTINRSYFPCEKNIAYDMNDYLFTFPDFMLTGLLSEMVLGDNSSVCLADITLSGSADNGKITVKAEGNLSDDAMAVYGDVAVTLMLVEDNVRGTQAVYNTTSQKVTNDITFRHDNVLRAYITSPTGDIVKTSGNTYSAEYSFDLKSEWDTSKLRVVGFVSRPAAGLSYSNLKYYDISDTNVLKLSDMSGIPTITADSTEGLSQYFTIDGKPAAAPLSPGLYIRRNADGSAEKVLIR